MLKRKITDRLVRFFETKERKALLISGARQVGKTYIIDEDSEYDIVTRRELLSGDKQYE